MEKKRKYIELIEEYTKENSLIYGIGSAEPFLWLKDEFEDKDIPFVSYEAEERVNPRLILPNASSIICLGMSYNRKYTGEMDNELRGNISAGAVGEDYHSLLSEHMSRLCNILEIDEIYFTDTGPLNDRAVAQLCSIGVRGKHFSIINPKIGSMFFIGYILTELELDSTSMEGFKPCESCDKCRVACPGGAIGEDGFEYKRCISYLTQAKELAEDSYRIMGKQLYGCDICQRVCPYNADYEPIRDGLDEYHPRLADILSMSNKEFSQRYKKTAAGWRGKKLMQRNAIIALMNSSDERSLELLERYKEDNREDIKRLIEYAIDKKRGER